MNIWSLEARDDYDVRGFKVSKSTETVGAVGVTDKNWKSKERRIPRTGTV